MSAIREAVLNHTFRYLKFFNNTLIPIEVGADDAETSSNGDITTGVPAVHTPGPPSEMPQTTVTSAVTTETFGTSTRSGSTENSYVTTVAQKIAGVVSDALNSTISSITELLYSNDSTQTFQDNPSQNSTVTTQNPAVPNSTDSINVSYHQDLSNRTISSLQTFHNATTLLQDLGNQTQSENSASSAIPVDLVPDKLNATKSILENVTNSTYQTLQYVTNSTVADMKEIVPTATSFLSDTKNSTDSTSEGLSTSALPTYESSTNSTFTSILQGFTNKTASALINFTSSAISAVEDAKDSSTHVQRETSSVYDVISEADDRTILNLNTTRLNHNWTITEVGHHTEMDRGGTDPYNSDPSQLLYIFAILGAYVIIICVLVLIQMRRRNRYETLDDEYYDEYLMRKQMLTERRTLLKMNIKNIRGVKDGYLLDKILQNEEV